MRILLLFAATLFAFTTVPAQPYTIQQYLNIKTASGPTLAPDGSKMAYLTNATGTSQVWVVDLPNGLRRRLTDYDDNVSFVRWLGDGSGLVFGKARGGDENTQFFWMRPDGTGVRELTTDPRVRHNFGAVSRDGRKLYYTSNKRNRSYFDVYSMEIASGREEMLYQFDGNVSIDAVSNDGSKIILSRSGTEKSLDNDLYLLDVASRKETHLTPHADAAEFGNSHFLGDGIIFTTNDGREFEGLAHLRRKDASADDWGRANQDLRMVVDERWDVGGVTFSEDNSMLAYTVNREGYSQLFLRRVDPVAGLASTARAEEIKLPGKGVVGGMTFSRNRSKLAFSFASPRHNSDIWLYDLAAGTSIQVTKSDLAGVPPASFVEPELIKFRSFDGREVPAWYYKPKVDKPKKKRPKVLLPVIVNVHGGPEGQERPGFNPLTQYYLSRGYAVLAPNVRGSTGYGKTYTHLDDVEKREDSVKDLAAAVEWLTRNGGADPRRIAVSGGSYGGYMVMAALTLYPELWAAGVNTVGIVNWETFLQNTSGYRRRQREVEYGRLDRDIEFLRRISPIRLIDRIRAPLFVIHGKNDPRVPYTEAEQVVKALRDRGAVVEYKLYDDEGHGISKLKNRLDLYPRVADFLDKYMKPATPVAYTADPVPISTTRPLAFDPLAASRTR
jgi:dipeptidyl aminopeptidase/acylaminoacyl peptidase